MAPENPPYYFGTKRSPLEQDYYEVLNQKNVRIHDLNAVPLKSFHEKGLLMADDQLHEFDAIALATGFDSYTGSLTQMGMSTIPQPHNGVTNKVSRSEEQRWRGAEGLVGGWHLNLSRDDHVWIPKSLYGVCNRSHFDVYAMLTH